ncbi:relaxase/mobilization nuclease domain-containing protein [Paraburkholderia silvatlantica]|uniref:MobA/VirD2-like nuclease domain-containing protein n=1 Tax=Paraburkholderia silvatlantica TaxID=321895 RepID=A0ABR6FN34_9BURK|nr:relaxase/mobilization nuclease domain-containing protein [Paraburkholderia silvatlantica]MBB2928532.1 hypothetical protein [Paraburkholderia silvatlantica]PVY23588.1 relaxase/mobilization nuclease-like protein [Paraburkholderia silvatlantica]PXW30826.1 relaxase/mobilization nuclease-like protein [Paraburkholderia silvatlantica]
MLVSNNKNAGTARSAIAYFFSPTNWKGEQRPHKPELLKGNPTLTIEADELSQKIRRKSDTEPLISGVIAFAKGERITKKQMLEVIGRFEDTFFGNMKDRVAPTYVLHDERDSFHIHYAFSKYDLLTGKSYNPFPPGTITRDLMKAFSALENHNFGFEQVKEKSLRTSQPFKDEAKAKVHSEHSVYFASLFKNSKDKRTFEQSCKDLVKSGLVKNRSELITFLKDAGYKFSRESDTYISIVNPNGRNFRLMGGIFANGSDYQQRIEEKRAQVKAFDPEKTAHQINRIIEARNSYNTKRYDTTEKQTYQAKAQERIKTPPQAASASGSTATPPPLPKTAPGATSPASGQTRAEQAQAPTKQAEENTASASDFSLSGHSAALDAIGSAEAQLTAALAQEASATTPAAKKQAQQAVINARVAVARAKARWLEEQRQIGQQAANRKGGMKI